MVAFASTSDQLQTKTKTEATTMKMGISDKIPAVLKQQARKITSYDLLSIGKNAFHRCFDIVQTAVEAAIAASSIEAKAKSANADTVFYHLDKLSVENVENMLKSHVRRAVGLVKRRFGNRKFAVAIDYTDEMFYGDENTEGIVGTKHKKGSNYAFKYLTVNIVTNGCRFFLFAYPVFQRGDNWVYVEKTLDLLGELGLRVHVLLLDREFNESKTLDLLQDRDYRYIIPAVQNSKFDRLKKTAERFPAIARCWEVAGIETTMIMLEEEGHIYGYVTNLPEEFYKDNVYVLSELYSKRWGIETAHRVEDDFRIYTTTKNGFIRYFFFVISVLIYNLWVWVNLTFGVDGIIYVKVDELRQLLMKMFEDFWRWLSSSDRWFSLHSLENGKRALFVCFWLLTGSAEALP